MFDFRSNCMLEILLYSTIGSERNIWWTCLRGQGSDVFLLGGWLFVPNRISSGGLHFLAMLVLPFSHDVASPRHSERSHRQLWQGPPAENMWKTRKSCIFGSKSVLITWAPKTTLCLNLAGRHKQTESMRILEWSHEATQTLHFLSFC